MSPSDIQAELRGQPFVPKRIFVSDGSEYDVHHPDMCMVLLTSIVVAIKGDSSQFYEQAVRIDCRHVTRILPLPVTSPPGQNGSAQPH
jgi:hypothetical protein